MIGYLERQGVWRDEAFAGAPLSFRHRRLLASYGATAPSRQEAVDRVTADLRFFLGVGALERAADLVVVLKCFVDPFRQTGKVQMQRKLRLCKTTDEMIH